MKKTILFFLIYCSLPLWASDCLAQITADSLNTIIKSEVENQIEKQLLYPKIFLGVSFGSLSILGIFLWVYKVKKIAENVVKERTQDLVERQIADKVGIKMETMRKYFQEREKQDEAIRQKRILVLNKESGKRLELEAIIRNAGFWANSEDFLLFRKLSEVLSVDDNKEEYTINTNKHDLLLIDNYDGKFTENEIQRLIDKYKGSLKLVCFTKSDFINYKALSELAKIVKMEERLGQALIDAVK